MWLPRALLAVIASAMALGCDGRPRPADASRTGQPKKYGPAVAVIDLSAGVPEQEKGGLFGVSGSKKSFDESDGSSTSPFSSAFSTSSCLAGTRLSKVRSCFVRQ